MNKHIAVTSALVAAGLAFAGSAYALSPADDSVAANYDVRLTVSGSSAFKTAFENELSRVGSSVCSNPAAGTATYNKYTTGGTPDLNAYSCNLVAGVVGSGGEKAIIYYRAEGGSVVGLSPIARGTNILRLKVDPAHCPGTVVAGGTLTCAVTGYNAVNDTASGAAVAAASQLGLSDEEPAVFTGENYPTTATFAFLQPSLSPSELTTLNNNSVALVGQAFGVYVNTSNADLNAVTSLSRTTIANIFQGVYADWSQVPLNDGSATVTSNPLPIKLCRREAGSGTQVSASLYFNDFLNTGAAFASEATPGNLDLGVGGGGVVENGSSGTMRTCISNNFVKGSASIAAGAIGFISSEADAAGRHQIQIDGRGTTIAETANNLGSAVATGDYGYWYEMTANKATSLTGLPLALANKLIGISQLQTTGPNTPNIVFLPGFNGANAQFPLNTPAGKQPVSCVSRGKNSKAVPGWQC